jgi:hypothetical protein
MQRAEPRLEFSSPADSILFTLHYFLLQGVRRERRYRESGDGKI